MSVLTSSKFVSTAAAGKDWRDVSKAILEALEPVRKDRPYNLGFLYVTDVMSSDIQSMLNIFKSVLNIENWVGTVGVGICASGKSYIDQPAASMLLGAFEEDDYFVFNAETFENAIPESWKDWLKLHDPMLSVAHANPISDNDPVLQIEAMEQNLGGFMVGGFSSSRHEHFQFAGDSFGSDLSGVTFSSDLQVATTLSQGCVPVGPQHTITLADEFLIKELDSQKAVAVFEEDLRSMAMTEIDQDPDTIMIDEDAVSNIELLPPHIQKLFQRQVHVAFPVLQSDQNDFLVRNIVQADPKEGTMRIDHPVVNGEQIMFVQRDGETIRADLSKKLIELRTRVQKETGDFKPLGALYFSCVARAPKTEQDDEMLLIRDIIGDVPLAGFYANGEINNARIYGYTGILVLFL